MKLQLLVPQYKETEDILINLLNSIAIQQGVDLKEIEVLIMNDGTAIHLTEAFLRQYPFSIKYFLSDHKGVSGIRQSLLDLATADYVMFCDADDMFASLLGLNLIFTNLYGTVNSVCDILVPAFYQEILPTHPSQDKNILFNYILKGEKEKGGIDGVFVHGKIYRRQFLVDNAIKWKPELTLNEDSYFNTLALMLAKSVRYCNIPYYIWKYNSNSITRSDPYWNLHNYHTLLESNIALLTEFIARDLLNQTKLYVCQMLYNSYFTTNADIWLVPQNKIYKTAIDKQLKQYIKTYGKYFEQAPAEMKQQVFNNQKTLKAPKGGPGITFNSWYKSLNKK